MSFPYTVNLDYGSEKVTGTAKRFALGTRGVSPDGRVFYYALNGGTAIEGGRLVQAPILEEMTSGALMGGTSVFVTAGSTKTTPATTIAIIPTTQINPSKLVDGWLIAMTTPSRAMYKIKQNLYVGSNSSVQTTVQTGGIEITLYEQDKLIHPLTTAHRLALVANPYSSTIVAPAALTGAIIGATCSAVAAATYYWLQTFGPSLVEYNSGELTAAAGSPVIPDSSVAGAFSGRVSNADLTDPLTTGATSETQALNKPTIGWLHTVPGLDAAAGFVFLAIRA